MGVTIFWDQERGSLGLLWFRVSCSQVDRQIHGFSYVWKGFWYKFHLGLVGQKKFQYFYLFRAIYSFFRFSLGTMTLTFNLYRFCYYFDVFTMFWLYFILFSWGQYRGYLGVSWGQLGIGVREILIGRRDCPAQRSGRCLVLTSLRRGDRPATTQIKKNIERMNSYWN